MAKQEYEVQRKYIGWETITVIAGDRDEAIELAEADGDWTEAIDQYQRTEDYWVRTISTGETAVCLENIGWEDSI